MKGKVKLWKVSVITLMLPMPVAVHNAVTFFFFFFSLVGRGVLSSFMRYKYMYVLHLTEVLLINTKNEACE